MRDSPPRPGRSRGARLRVTGPRYTASASAPGAAAAQTETGSPTAVSRVLPKASREAGARGKRKSRTPETGRQPDYISQNAPRGAVQADAGRPTCGRARGRVALRVFPGGDPVRGGREGASASGRTLSLPVRCVLLFSVSASVNGGH